MDVGPQLLKNAIDLFLGSNEVLEWGSIHLSHVSLILLDGDDGVASREEQGHLAARETRLYEHRHPRVWPCCWDTEVGRELGPPRTWGAPDSLKGSKVPTSLAGRAFSVHLGPSLCHTVWVHNAWLQSPEFRPGAGNPCLACSTLTQREEESWDDTITHTGIPRWKSGRNWTYLLNTITLKDHRQ